MKSNGERLNEYVNDCANRVMHTDFEVLGEIAELILATKFSDDGKVHRIFTIGNGGSGATASHMVNDLTKGCRVCDMPGFNVMSLVDSQVLVTCIGNDFSYEDIFSIPLETFANEGDLLIAFSGSGNSPNIVKACETAHKLGMKVAGFGGRDGGKMKGHCDTCLIAPTDSMEKLEDMHMIYVHALVVLLKEKLGEIYDRK